MNKSKEIGKRIKENKRQVLSCLLIFIVTLCVTLMYYEPVLGKKAEGNEFYGYIINDPIEITKETVIKQKLSTSEEITRGIALHFATYARENNGNVFITVSGAESKKEYAKIKINVDSLQDNAYYFFNLDENIDKNVDKEIIFEISSDSLPGEAVGIHKTENQRIKGGKLTVNDKEIQNEDLIVRYISDSSSSKTIYVLLISLTVISILSLIIITLTNAKKEIVFTTMTVLIGVVFCFLFTPYSIPDEEHHALVVNEMASYCIYGDYTKVDESYMNFEKFQPGYNRGSEYRQIIKNWNKNVGPTNINIGGIDIFEDDTYIVYYFPQTLGVLLGRLVNMNFYGTFYLGRIFNLLFYAMCVYISIKKSPIHKTLFGIISCLPIFLQQAASYSYDSFINGLCLISISYLLKWVLEDKKIEKSDYIIVFITCLGLAPAKYVYGFFALLYWLVPTSRFSSMKNRIIFTLLLCAPMLWQLIPILGPRFISLFKSMFSSKTISASTHNIETTVLGLEDKVEEIQMYDFKYCLSHPMEVMKIVLSTIRYNLKTWFYGSIGRYLSGLTITLPLTLIHILLGIVVVSAFIKEDYIPSIYLKITSLVICVLIGMFTLGGMLLYWTSTKDTYIQGVQGRYFSPLLPYCFMILNNKKISLPKSINKYVIFSYLLILFEVIVYVMSCTFVN